MKSVAGAVVVSDMDPVISYRDWLETFTAITGGSVNEVVKMSEDQIESRVEELFHFDTESAYRGRKQCAASV